MSEVFQTIFKFRLFRKKYFQKSNVIVAANSRGIIQILEVD